MTQGECRSHLIPPNASFLVGSYRANQLLSDLFSKQGAFPWLRFTKLRFNGLREFIIKHFKGQHSQAIAVKIPSMLLESEV